MKQQWDADSVLDLFNSGSYWRPRAMQEDYATVAVFLNREWVSIEAVRYTPTPQPKSKGWPPSEDRLAFANACRGSGGAAHQMLKWSAWNWLRARGEPTPECECPAPHGMADVVAPTIGHIVECGDTDPLNMLRVLGSVHWSTFVLFPFLYAGDEPTCYVFRLSEGGRPHLSEYLLGLTGLGSARYLGV